MGGVISASQIGGFVRNRERAWGSIDVDVEGYYDIGGGEWSCGAKSGGRGVDSSTSVYSKTSFLETTFSVCCQTHLCNAF